MRGGHIAWLIGGLILAAIGAYAYIGAAKVKVDKAVPPSVARGLTGNIRSAAEVALQGAQLIDDIERAF